jgi:hypothetical protein
MDAEPSAGGKSQSNTARRPGATFTMEIVGAQQDRRHNFVHRDTANAATKYMTQDAQLKIVRKTGSRKN